MADFYWIRRKNGASIAGVFWTFSLAVPTIEPYPLVFLRWQCIIGGLSIAPLDYEKPEDASLESNIDMENS